MSYKVGHVNAQTSDRNTELFVMCISLIHMTFWFWDLKKLASIPHDTVAYKIVNWLFDIVEKMWKIEEVKCLHKEIQLAC